MSLEVIGSFKALTYDNSLYNFVITSNNEIYCQEFGDIGSSNILDLKPNFVLRNITGRTVYSLDEYVRTRNIQKSLIKEYIISDEVLDYLIKNRMLMYSGDTAILYGFDPKYAFDAYQKKPFHRTKNKPLKRARILEPKRKGNFN